MSICVCAYVCQRETEAQIKYIACLPPYEGSVKSLANFPITSEASSKDALGGIQLIL